MVKLNYGIALECVSLYFGHICIRGLYTCPNCPKNDPKCIRPCILQPLIRCYAQESNSIRSNSVFGSWSTAQLIHLPDPLPDRDPDPDPDPRLSNAMGAK